MQINDIINLSSQYKSQQVNATNEWNNKLVTFYDYKHNQMVAARAILDNFILACKTMNVPKEVYHYYELAGND